MTSPEAADARDARQLERVAAFLEARGLSDRLITFQAGATRTSQEAADALGCELGQVVKSLVFDAGGEPVLALVAGDRRGDAEAISTLLGVARVRLADPQTVLAATGYAVGGVSPFDLPSSLRVLVDDSLARFDTLYPAGGTAQTMVRLSREELLALAGGAMARISR